MLMDENAGLADRLPVATLLRLVLDRGGELIQGEVVTMRGESLGRFRDWLQANRVIRAWALREGRDI
jgi:hypothetical protein